MTFNRVLTGVKAWYLFFRDICCIISGPVVKVGVGAVAASVAWNYKDIIETHIRALIA